MTSTIKNDGLRGMQVIKAGKVQTTGDNITANTQYTFSVTDPQIQSTDLLIAQLYLIGANSKGVSAPRCNCASGIAYMNFLTTETYHSGVTVGFQYMILRTH